MNNKKFILGSIKYAILIIWGVLFIAPIIWMISNSLKTENAYFNEMSSIFTFLPSRNPLEWSGAYSEVLGRFHLIRSVLNSFLYASITVVGSIIVNSMAGYALSRFKFPFRKALLIIIIAILIVPMENLYIPLFTIVHKLKLTNTYQGLILPFITNVFYIYLFKQFFDSIPKEYEEAAQIDGASRARIFIQVIAPLAKSIYATVAIMAFITSWNDYLWPLMVMTDNTKYPIQVAINVLFNTLPKFNNQIMAALTIATIPVVIVYATMQKYITQGMAGVGIK